MIVRETDLFTVATKAVNARNAGQRFLTFEIEASQPLWLTRTIRLWDGVLADKISVRYENGIQYIKVRAACASLIEAYRRVLVGTPAYNPLSGDSTTR